MSGVLVEGVKLSIPQKIKAKDSMKCLDILDKYTDLLEYIPYLIWDDSVDKLLLLRAELSRILQLKCDEVSDSARLDSLFKTSESVRHRAERFFCKITGTEI